MKGTNVLSGEIELKHNFNRTTYVHECAVDNLENWTDYTNSLLMILYLPNLKIEGVINPY